MNQKYIDKEINEQNFQDALINNDTDGMWQAVFFTCQNICKSIYAKRGFIASEDDLYDTAMNATEMVMRNILERGVKPEKLSSYCYTRCLCFANGYKQDKMSRKLKDFLSNNDFSNNINYDNFIDNEDL